MPDENTVMHFYVDAQKGNDKNADGTIDHPFRTIHGARSSMSQSVQYGGMKYRAGVLHFVGKFMRSFVPMSPPYPSPHISPGGNVISEWCRSAPSLTNENWFKNYGPMKFEADQGPTIFSAFEIDPEPGSPPGTWGPQGGPGIYLKNVCSVEVNGHWNLEIWGGLPEPVQVLSDNPLQPADDVFVRETIIRFVDEEFIYRLNKEGGRRIWLQNCFIDPDGTATPEEIVEHYQEKKYVRGGFGRGLVNTRIA